jgi:hypothetical protein
MNKPWMLGILVASTLMTAGCSSSFWGGTGAGVVGAGAGYEVRANQELKRIKDDLNAGRIDQREYDIRKDQIGRFSFIE